MLTSDEKEIAFKLFAPNLFPLIRLGFASTTDPSGDDDDDRQKLSNVANLQLKQIAIERSAS